MTKKRLKEASILRAKSHLDHDLKLENGSFAPRTVASFAPLLGLR